MKFYNKKLFLFEKINGVKDVSTKFYLKNLKRSLTLKDLVLGAKEC